MPYTSAAVQLGSTRRAEAPLPPGAPFYKRLWRGWQRIARAFGNLLSRTVTTILYVIAVPIFAIGVRLFADPLAIKRPPKTWSPHPPAPSGPEEARHGF